MTFERDFDQQTAVVTGGTRGLGAAITSAFLAAGASVHATYAGNEDAARAFAEKLGPLAERLRLHRFDVADHAACERFWNELGDAEPVHVLVNNAGIRRDAIAGAMKVGDWDAVIATNLSGSFHMSKFAIQRMSRARYGRIVMVSSPAGLHGFAGQANYGASKAGQIGLMRALAKEVGKRKITVNCVAPGFVDTELLADLPKEVRDEHVKTVPAGRFGTPDEIAFAVLSLAHPRASYVHGAVLEVTGGL
ncbi:MAG: 3-oxoacyl-ACP reductase FabG [Planctomycetes bacterium]|nr:3-oxoacyl-ACP reductase FabG [Planctomycetota bacterium]